MSVRAPAVAGTFYPSSPGELRRAIQSCLSPGPRVRALAVVVPHAGYVYSGRVAGAVYGGVEVPRDVVLLCFNHRGHGADIAVWPRGAWRTPLGDAPVEEGLARRIREACGGDFDETGHLGEHSGEVQVPFLQAVRPDVRVVPVALSVGPDDPRLETFGAALAGLGGDFLVVASTDLNHYEDQETTLRKDAAVIGAIEALDGPALRALLRGGGVSMCGFAPVLAAIAFARARGAVRARTLVHATSGDAGGGYDRVVGYAGMLVPAMN